MIRMEILALLLLLVTFASCAKGQVDSSGSSDDSGSGQGMTCRTGEVMLVDGLNDKEGRVEVCINGAYGTVCDNQWSVSDARVVCKQLGLPWKGASQHSSAYFGQGKGEIVLDDVRCNGNEFNLLECEYDLNTLDCNHFHDAGVTCSESPDECDDGNIQLVGGKTVNEGRVEVCAFGQWGTVCDDGWNTAGAKVVCDSLGIFGAAIPKSFGPGEGIIHLDDLDCDGDEGDIFNCSYTHDNNCDHDEDIGVVCGITPECKDGEMQLAGSNDPNQGRVEVCSFGVWGTVCDDFWDATDATVVCKQLGLEYTGAIAYRNAHFGVGNGPILFDNVFCTGNESSLSDCPHSSEHNCNHFEDASVVCGSRYCNESDVRLVNGFTEYEGRVEVCLNGVWGTVCDDFWSESDAKVTCRQLGLSFDAAVAIGSAYFGLGSGPISMDNVFCEGTESLLVGCSYSAAHNCYHSEDASVICVDTQSNCTDGEVRLVGGTNETEGRVELCVDKEWGTICDDQWGDTEAQVICRQLGLTTQDAVGILNAAYGQGSGEIYLDNVNCNGDENDIFACDYTMDHNCIHAEDAGVQCGLGSECIHGEVNLVGGNNYTEGRVEVCFHGYWGTVCDDSWSFEDARVVCKQLGYPYEGARALSFGHYGIGSGQINMDEVQCTGDEDQLINCTFTQEHNCVHAEDASVECGEAECSEGEVRLVGGINETEGRVEVCLGGNWGSVCDDGWGVTDARVVCQQLGYPSSGAIAHGLAQFGQGSGPIVLDDINCNGTENSILDCRYDPDTSDCTHFEDAGVVCAESPFECNDTDVRLVGGKNESEGRVEVCLFGEWGTVCDDFWTKPDATVVCSQLGYPYKGAQALKEAYFGEGSGKIHMDDVECSGNESLLLNCNYEPDHNCGHSEDASVICGDPVCEEGDVRLVGGGNKYEGRIELCFGGVWGTVCADFWGNTDARVVCNQLGYSKEGALGFGKAYFGSGTGPIHIDDVQCGGGESTLLQCNYQNNHNCFHSNDAGVRCSPVSPTSTPTLLGSCGLAGFSGCCNTSTEENCFGATGNCFCDELCYEFGNCCDDIQDIGCLSPTPTPIPSFGSCVDQDFNGCCSLSDYPSCLGSDDICYCDQICYMFGDCCMDIQKIGCYATANSPTFEPPESTSSSSLSVMLFTTPGFSPISTSTPPTMTTMSSISTTSSSSSLSFSSLANISTSKVSSLVSQAESTSSSSLSVVLSTTSGFSPTLTAISPTTTTMSSTSTTSTTSSLSSSGLANRSTSRLSSFVSQSTSPTPTPRVPGKVQHLTVVSINSSAVNITWNYPVNSTGISEYEIIVQHRSGDVVKTDSVPVIRTQHLSYYIISDLDPYIPYTVSVVAFNTINEIGQPTSKDFFVKEGIPQFAPANVIVMRINSTAINISWNPIPLESARGFIIQYSVTYQLVDGSDPVTVYVDSSKTFVIISGLGNGELYGAKLAGITSVGKGPTSPISYEEGVRPPSNSGNDAGFIVAGAVVIIGIVLVVLAVVVIPIVLFRKRFNCKKKYIYNTKSAAETDRELLQYTDKSDFSADNKEDMELPDKVKKVHAQSWGSSAIETGESSVGTYTQLKDDQNIESEIFEL